MDAQAYEVVKVIGEGAFGSVSVVKRTDDKEFAMKTVPISSMYEKDREDAVKECQLLASLRHPRIVDFVAAFLSDDGKNLCIVMDYCEKGDLAGRIKKCIEDNLQISEETIWLNMLQMAEGLAFLHSQNIAHRDLKPGNVFLAADGSAKLGDLNISKIASQENVLATCIGTPLYMAPEVWEDEPYTIKCDVWSLGCVVYELAARQTCFRGKTTYKIQKAVLKGEFTPLPEGLYSADLTTLIAEMLVVDPEARLSSKQVLEHPLVQKRITDGSLSPSASVAVEEGVDVELLSTIKATALATAMLRASSADKIGSSGSGGGGSGGGGSSSLTATGSGGGSPSGAKGEEQLSQQLQALNVRAQSRGSTPNSVGSPGGKVRRASSRFTLDLPVFFADCGLTHRESAFVEDLGVNSLADLALLTDEDLGKILADAHEIAAFKAHIKSKHVARHKSQDLVGLWVDVEGCGPGKVTGFSKATMGLFFDSMHKIEFLATGLGTKQVLLRRRKQWKWNKGARYTVLPGEPAHADVSAALANDKEVGAKAPAMWVPDATAENSGDWRASSGEETAGGDGAATVRAGHNAASQPATTEDTPPPPPP